MSKAIRLKATTALEARREARNLFPRSAVVVRGYDEDGEFVYGAMVDTALAPNRDPKRAVTFIAEEQK